MRGGNVKPGGKPFKAPAMSPRTPAAVKWANNSGFKGTSAQL
jgi:hypothetical protein